MLLLAHLTDEEVGHPGLRNFAESLWPPRLSRAGTWAEADHEASGVASSCLDGPVPPPPWAQCPPTSPPQAQGPTRPPTHQLLTPNPAPCQAQSRSPGWTGQLPSGCGRAKHREAGAECSRRNFVKAAAPGARADLGWGTPGVGQAAAHTDLEPPHGDLAAGGAGGAAGAGVGSTPYRQGLKAVPSS